VHPEYIEPEHRLGFETIATNKTVLKELEPTFEPTMDEMANGADRLCLGWMLAFSVGAAMYTVL